MVRPQRNCRGTSALNSKGRICRWRPLAALLLYCGEGRQRCSVLTTTTMHCTFLRAVVQCWRSFWQNLLISSKWSHYLQFMVDIVLVVHLWVVRFLLVCLRLLHVLADPHKPVKWEVLIDICDLKQTTGPITAEAIKENLERQDTDYWLQRTDIQHDRVNELWQEGCPSRDFQTCPGCELPRLLSPLIQSSNLTCLQDPVHCEYAG